MGPSSAFQDEVHTKEVHSEAKNQGLPKMKMRIWIQFVFKAEQQPGAASGGALMPEAKLGCAALKAQQSHSAFSGVAGEQNPTFLLLL